MSETCTQAEFARRRGVSKQAVNFALKRGLITAEPDGRLDFDKCTAEWDARSHSRAVKAARTPKLRVVGARVREESINKQREWTEKATEARARKEMVDAQRSEMKLQVESAAYVERRQVEKDAFEVFRALRDSLLSLPDRLAAQVAAQRDVADVHYTLDAEIRAVLANFADKVAEEVA